MIFPWQVDHHITSDKPKFKKKPPLYDGKNIREEATYSESVSGLVVSNAICPWVQSATIYLVLLTPARSVLVFNYLDHSNVSEAVTFLRQSFRMPPFKLANISPEPDLDVTIIGNLTYTFLGPLIAYILRCVYIVRCINK